jgi:uncharacterized protein (DUF2225 family)
VPKAEKIKCPLCGVKWKIKENKEENEIIGLLGN